jgi:DNA-binding LacI/PurR family transcriptional regulator
MVEKHIASVRRQGHLGLVLRAGLLVADPFNTPLMRGVADAASEHLMQLSVWSQPYESGRTITATAPPLELDGVVIRQEAASDPWLAELAAEHVPIVCIGRWAGAPGIVQMIDADHEVGAEMLMNHLAELGRRKVAAIAGPLDVFDVILRLQAYERKRIDLDLDLDPALVAVGDFSIRSGRDAMCALLRRPPAQRPDAVFAMNDAMAVGAIKAILDVGLRVPEDIAVVGFDDVLDPELLPMTLTTIRQDVHGLGERAVRALLELIEGARPGDPEIVPVELVLGESTIGR